MDLLAGGFAGFCSVMFNNPIDVIKTKMQNKNGLGLTVRTTASYIYESRGFIGFYSGVVPRLARVVLDAALTFSIFHQIKRTVANYISGK